MIIQCPKCLTKFKLDDTKVKDEGTKVRCAKCKEVFLVKKEVTAPPVQPVPPEIPAEKDEFDFSFTPPKEEEKEKTPSPAPPAPQEMPAEKEEVGFPAGPSKGEEKEETSFGFGAGFEEEGAKKEEEPERTAFSFGGSLTGEEEAAKEEKVSEWSGMSYGEVSLPPTEETKTKQGETFGGFEPGRAEEAAFGEVSIKEEPKPEAPHEEAAFGEVSIREEPKPEAPHEEAFVRPKETTVPPPVAEEKAPLEGKFVEKGPRSGFERETFQEEFPAEAKGKVKRHSFFRVFLYIMVTCTVAAVPLWYLWTNYKAAETGEISLADLNGYYSQNAEAGAIFVVTGRGVNNTNRARSFFQVRGILFNKNGEKLAQKEVYCGNIFSAKEVTVLSKAKIEADLKNKVGGSLSNINLAPGKAVPFMIVFFDLPKDLSDFSVEVTSSQIASE